MIALGFGVFHTLHLHPDLFALFFVQILSILNSVMLLGIGMALPLIVLATILSWVHFILLAMGKINPHLGKEGLLNVLRTLLSKI